MAFIDITTIICSLNDHSLGTTTDLQLPNNQVATKSLYWSIQNGSNQNIQGHVTISFSQEVSWYLTVYKVADHKACQPKWGSTIKYCYQNSGFKKK